MFGFLKPPSHREYRQAYARCCSLQRSRFGLRSLVFVSYEAVFLYCAGIDLKLVPAPRESDPKCCRTRGVRLHDWSAKESTAAEFAGNFAMLLAKTKLDDDVQDSGSLLAWSARLAMRRQTKKMKASFRAYDPDFEIDLGKCLTEHAALESTAERHSVEQYTQPTARAFGLVFALFAKQMGSPDEQDLLRTIGERVGAALIASDCAHDWKMDQRRGHYNPIAEESVIPHYYSYAIRQLVEAGWRLSDRCKDESIAASVLLHRIGFLSAARSGNVESACEVNRSKRAKGPIASPWRRRQLQAARAGDCDCGGCDCACDLCCSGAECGQFCDITYCPCDVPCDCCDCGNKKKAGGKKVKSSAVETSLLGAPGTSKTVLDPYGTIEVKGVEYAAKSQSGVIEQGSDIVVCAKESFGYVVRERK